MPDPTLSDAAKEAYALAPADEVVIDTLEIRHPDFVDEAGNPDSMWITTNQVEIEAPVEADAPVRGGETVTFRSLGFRFTLPRIEPGSGPEMEIGIDSTDRRIIELLDAAATDPRPIVMCYRPYLSNALEDGPQMAPPPSFVLSQVAAKGLVTSGRARVAIDLGGPFPRHVYTASAYPGLIGQ